LVFILSCDGVGRLPSAGSRSGVWQIDCQVSVVRDGQDPESRACAYADIGRRAAVPRNSGRAGKPNPQALANWRALRRRTVVFSFFKMCINIRSSDKRMPGK